MNYNKIAVTSRNFLPCKKIYTLILIINVYIFCGILHYFSPTYIYAQLFNINSYANFNES